MSEIEIDKTYIEKRVNDWITRVKNLYSLTEKVAKNRGGICHENGTVYMYEELMKEFDVNPTQLPILNLCNKNDEKVATFRPIGLWVIGANGRVDILTKNGAYILVDVTKTNFEKPNWQVYSPQDKKHGKKFDESFIAELVA